MTRKECKLDLSLQQIQTLDMQQDVHNLYMFLITVFTVKLRELVNNNFFLNKVN